MSGYTKVNLKELEDHAPTFGLSPGLEFRSAREALELERSGISYQRLAPGFRQPFGHSHAEQEEVYVLVGGSARMKLDDEVVELERWDAVRIAGHTMRNVEAGPDGAELICFGAPNTGPGDAQLVPGWWSE